MNILSKLQRPDRPSITAPYSGPRIAAIYGLSAREHMQRHLLRFLREAGFVDATLYGHLQATTIVEDLQQAAAQGRPIALVGYSQGGLEAMRVARLLGARGVPVQLLVLIAARGKGRIFPHGWRADMRNVPANVALCLNAFAMGDVLGSDARREDNLIVADDPVSRVENIVFERSEGISHIGIARCYPEAKQPARLKALLHDRLLAALAALSKVSD